jgi:hypothetical protein
MLTTRQYEILAFVLQTDDFDTISSITRSDGRCASSYDHGARNEPGHRCGRQSVRRAVSRRRKVYPAAKR